ncbi:Nucleosome assembly protein 1-like 1 [Armadillidium nasatum]|uniref:Nucleosome assembly protein 1-like 1 n=1 Tax=Armadillidium nasatum TaxID=96803 RepID=A0A5N5TI50_9CRUS|nr:Nucleosome assembly protein 1-like 1 [Armadillidium nasatum]
MKSVRRCKCLFWKREEVSSIPEEQIECVSDDEDVVDGQDLKRKESTSENTDFKSLPECIKRRVRALKALQLKIKNDKIRSSLLEKRLSILSGEYEPTDEECDFPPDDLNESKNQIKIEKANFPIYNENVKGIPGFWLTVFKNSSILEETIHERDEPVLLHLEDIKNKVLTKYYELSIEPNKDYPFGFDGPETINSKGCKIDWKEGKNITQKTPKLPRGSTIRTITRSVNSDSFFNFFSPPTVPEKDSSIGRHYPRIFLLKISNWDRIVPRAVLYFTGDAYDDEDEDYEDLRRGGSGRIGCYLMI